MYIKEYILFLIKKNKKSISFIIILFILLSSTIEIDYNYATINYNNITEKVDKNLINENLAEENIYKIKLNYECDNLNEKAIFVKNNYSDEIKKYSEMYGLDEKFMIGLATQERGEHSSTIDEGGGIGLFQVQYNVWVDKEIISYNYLLDNYETVTITDQMLREIDGNTKIACMIFQNNFYLFYNNLMGAALGYNSGPTSANEVFNAFYNDTKIEAEKALKNYDNYDWLNYRKFSSVGDSEYVENIMRYIGENEKFTFMNSEKEKIEFNIVCAKAKVKALKK